jgi:hypothetical protein
VPPSNALFWLILFAVKKNRMIQYYKEVYIWGKNTSKSAREERTAGMSVISAR